MSFITSSKKISFTLDDELMERVNSRIPRSVKISVLARWLMCAIVSTPSELAQTCQNNEDEARQVSTYLQEALGKLFNAVQTKEGGK